MDHTSVLFVLQVPEITLRSAADSHTVRIRSGISNSKKIYGLLTNTGMKEKVGNGYTFVDVMKV